MVASSAPCSCNDAVQAVQKHLWKHMLAMKVLKFSFVSPYVTGEKTALHTAGPNFCNEALSWSPLKTITASRHQLSSIPLPEPVFLENEGALLQGHMLGLDEEEKHEDGHHNDARRKEEEGCPLHKPSRSMSGFQNWMMT